LYNITDDVVLPVTLTYWEAKIDNRKAVLNWVVQHKEACRFIEIEKSTDNKNWKTISRVAALHQSYTDDIIEKNNYYRLKLVAGSGPFVYSSTKKLSPHEALLFVSVSSNPRELTINIEDSKVKTLAVSVYDSEGKNLVQQAVRCSANNGRFLLPHALPKGIYIIEIKQGFNRAVKKISVP
jgi:hypothetical protein